MHLWLAMPRLQACAILLTHHCAPMAGNDALAGLCRPALVALDGVALIEDAVQPLPGADPLNVSAQVLVRHDQQVGALAISA
eukprot:1158842-Pelagomonas_calceolata.AAC.7